jgi:hypothetical protein
MSWKEETIPAGELLEWRGGVQLLGKGGWCDICMIGMDGKEMGKSACPKAALRTL